MLITETHKNFSCGSKGRLTIKSDAGQVLAVIFTPVQKARKFCETNPESQQGVHFKAAVEILTVLEQRGAVPEGLVISAADAQSMLEQLVDDDQDDTVGGATVPAPPVLTGANPGNTALVSAQRKLAKLHEAALADGAAAVQAIKTSRGNKYLNTCDDYKTALLAHFGVAAPAA